MVRKEKPVLVVVSSEKETGEIISFAL